MSQFNETHPYQVSIWTPGNDNPKSILERGAWVEYARCITKERANEVALSLSIRHPKGVQVAELVRDERGARFVGYKFLPASSSELIAGQS
jgi:hypothetical protein